jgi:8-oxo-dGTP diphosphatase
VTDPVRVVAAVFARDDQVLVCRRAADRAAGGRWEFPGGKIESGESPEDALRREILEELGVLITVGDLINTGVTDVDGRSIELSGYRVIDYSPSPTSSTDHDQLCWRPVAELADLDWAEPDLPIVDELINSTG